MRFATWIMTLSFCAVIALLMSSPVAAQEITAPDNPSADTRETELRDWWESLPENRKRQLLQRRRALKRLPDEQRDQLIERAREGEPVLSEEQRERLQRFRNLPDMQRLRLYTLAAEIHALRRGNPRMFREVMQKTGRERARMLRTLLSQQRMKLYAQVLPEEEQQRLRAMDPNERVRYFVQRKREIVETLAGYHESTIKELRELARTGDEQARRELRQAMGDLLTLAMLIQRLSPELQKKALSEIKGMTVERSAETIRKTLQQQWKDEMRRRRNDPRRNNQRNRTRPEERGDRNRRTDRRRD